jgi:hypothetical protein
MDDSTFIDPASAVEHAKRGLDRTDPKGDLALAEARRAGQPGAPVLVVRLDMPGQGYYLVPWQDERGILLIVQVDARTGALSSLAALSSPLERLVLRGEEARRIVQERTNARVVGEPRLVWQPCREAANPLQPFSQVFIEGGSVFVSGCGKVHNTLTPFGKGG